MAKKKARRTRGKLTGYLTQRYLYYDLDHQTGGSEDFHYIDLARDLSAINCRLYRQGMLYGIQSFSIHNSQENTEVRIGTIPTVWPVLSAYRLARRKWNAQIKAQGMQSLRGAWDDFRIFMNQDHITDPDQVAVVDIESGYPGTQNESVLYGEYNASMLSAIGPGNSSALAMLGQTNDAASGTLPTAYGGASYNGIIGIVEEWNKIKPDVSETPNSGSENAESSAFADGNLGLTDATYDDAVVNRIEDDGDAPPYSVSPGGYLVSSGKDSYTVREAHMATGQKSLMLPGCEAFCGLLQVETKSPTSSDTIGLLVELAPGAYKGVHAVEL